MQNSDISSLASIADYEHLRDDAKKRLFKRSNSANVLDFVAAKNYKEIIDNYSKVKHDGYAIVYGSTNLIELIEEIEIRLDELNYNNKNK